VFYLFGDHLGSSSLVVDWQGRTVSEIRYTPWGETRWSWDTDARGYTERLFTSHKRENQNHTGNLSDFGGRFYSSYTARFISADVLVTDPNNPAVYNRFSYVGNNPLRYTDPDGHCWPVCTVIAGAVIGAAVGAGMQVLANAAAGKPLDTDVGKAAVVGGVSGAIGGLLPGAGSVVGAVVFGAVEGAVTGQVARAVENVASGRKWDAGLGNLGDIALDATIGGVTSGAGFGVGKIFGGARATSLADDIAGEAKSTLRFGADDLVYGPSAGGKLRELANEAGGKTLNDFSGPSSGQTWTEYSIQILERQVEVGGKIHFDLTHMKDIQGVLKNTGAYAKTTTGDELRHIRKNWNRFRLSTSFYQDKVKVLPPWTKQ
jgi:RHS repeat-associated protein